jgi:hypothetical protein
MFSDRAALRERRAQQEEERLRAVERKMQLLEMGGGGRHPERFLPKAEVPCLSESIQRLYK